MSRDRFRAGVYQLTIPAGIGSQTVSIDNKSVVFLQNTSATIYVNNQLSFDSGKLTALWMAENLKGLSGQVTG